MDQPRLIPVIDVLQGVAVRAVAGRRSEYRPLKSVLVQSTDPIQVARTLLSAFGFGELYVADLDAIGSGGAGGARGAGGVGRGNEAMVGELARLGANLLLDAGIRSATEACQWASRGVGQVVAGLETLPARRVLAECIEQLGPDRVVFSLDLYDGRPLAAAAEWQKATPLEIARDALALGVRRFILLDLSRVGTGRGTGTEDLCQQVCELGRARQARVIVGGGVRDREALNHWTKTGVDAVLVASALHDGRIRPPRAGHGR